MDPIYLDNNATTQPAPQVVAAMTEVNERLWANPSSVHRFGQMVRQRIELARTAVARLVGCKDRELVFTSGGTESNNLAIRGVLMGKGAGTGNSGSATGDRGQGSGDGAARRLLFTTKVEHSAVREPAVMLAGAGVEVVYLPVTIDGLVTAERLAAALEEHVKPGDTALVSVQWANNETGVIQPVGELAKVVGEARVKLKEREAVVAREAPSGGGAGGGARGRVLFHVDATQAVGKVAVDLNVAGIDLMTFAAHKFHGPKGVGALFIRGGVKLHPQNLGGPQERDRRGGTENTAGIIGMGVAAELAKAFVDDAAAVARQEALRDRFERAIVSELPDTVINSAGAPRLWNTSSLGFPRLEAEAVLLGLSERGVCASAGAACSSGSLEPSPVLLAMGIPEIVAHGSVRFSISRYTTKEEIEAATPVVIEVVRKLGRTLPVGAAR